MKKFITLDEFIKELRRFINYVKISDNDAEYEFWNLVRNFKKDGFTINLNFRRKNEQKDRYICRI